MDKLIYIIVFIVIINLLTKWLLYYFTTTGLLYYISTKYGEIVDEKKVKELAIYSGTRIVKEFFHLK